MKKIISQISLILLIITIGIMSVFISQVNAESIAGLNVSSATEGGTISVSLILPSADAFANCDLEITYSDGSKATDKLVYINTNVGGIVVNSPNLVTFPAKVAGTATVRATSIAITKEDGTILEEGGSKEQTITIASKTPAPSTTPEPTPTPDTNTGNASSSENNNSSNNSSSNNTTSQTKEPEVVNPTFKDVNETVYAVSGCNVRSSCSTEISSNKIGGLTKGQAVKRTGVEGTWSRIDYNGKTAYVATRLLTTEKPVEEEPENTAVENTVKSQNTVSTNSVANNTVDSNTLGENVISNNVVSNEQILNQIEQEIGVLPEVGHNIASILFTIISIFTLIIVMRLQYKTDK